MTESEFEAMVEMAIDNAQALLPIANNAKQPIRKAFLLRLQAELLIQLRLAKKEGLRAQRPTG